MFEKSLLLVIGTSYFEWARIISYIRKAIFPYEH